MKLLVIHSYAYIENAYNPGVKIFGWMFYFFFLNISLNLGAFLRNQITVYI